MQGVVHLPAHFGYRLLLPSPRPLRTDAKLDLSHSAWFLRPLSSGSRYGFFLRSVSYCSSYISIIRINVQLLLRHQRAGHLQSSLYLLVDEVDHSALFFTTRSRSSALVSQPSYLS
jgi:hypothetical protein